MNSQLNTDARVDQILTTLRTTDPPAGLEQRIAARLAQATQDRIQSTSARFSPSHASVILNAVKDHCISFGPAQRYSAVAAAFLIALTLTFVHNRPASNIAQTDFNYHSNRVAQDHATSSTLATKDVASSSSAVARDHATNAGFERAGLQSRHHVPAGRAALAAERISHPRPSPASAQDPDQLALAETLAPSRPTPPMPLTMQEQVMVAATRPGQPIQLAELDLARAPMIRAEAEARRNQEIERYVKTLLAPFAVADALQPTKFSEPQEISTATPAPPPNNSSTN